MKKGILFLLIVCILTGSFVQQAIAIAGRKPVLHGTVLAGPFYTQSSSYHWYSTIAFIVIDNKGYAKGEEFFLAGRNIINNSLFLLKILKLPKVGEKLWSLTIVGNGKTLTVLSNSPKDLKETDFFSKTEMKE